jgi:hypothetical protein
MMFQDVPSMFQDVPSMFQACSNMFHAYSKMFRACSKILGTTLEGPDIFGAGFRAGLEHLGT